MPLWLALLLLAAPSTTAQVWREKAEGDPPPATVAALALAIRSRAIQDSRCYLMNGGAVESFYISEDTPVGSVIGTLSVNGDPSSQQGNISLRLQEQGANVGVGIAAGSKNLTLLRALDREERQGPSNLYVNVRCDRRGTADPSFIIPVSVRVWDVNDNAPVWVGAPYRARVSELTGVGARLPILLRATDADQPGPHATLHYEVLPGPQSDYVWFPNELEPVLVVRRALDYEAARNVTVTLRARDGGDPPRHNDTYLHITVLDADDQNPKFTHEHYTAVIPHNAKQGDVMMTSPGSISARDQDVGIDAPLYYSATGDNAHLLNLDRDSARVLITKQLLEDLQHPHTFVIKATQVDNADRYALATLTVRGAAGAVGAVGVASTSATSTDAAGAGAASTSGGGVRFTSRAYFGAVPEDAPIGTVVLTLTTIPPANPDERSLQFYVSERSFLERFAISGGGAVVLRRALDHEAQDYYRYQVMVTDHLANDTASINITVLNVNEWEPRFRYPQYEFRVEEGVQGEGSEGEGEGLVRVGRLDVHDGDKPDTVTLTLRGADAGMFYVNSSGEMFLRQSALATANSSVLHLVATAVDSGTPPRQTSVPVIVHVGSRLLREAGGPRGLSSVAVVGVFAAALAALLTLVCALLLYIYRNKRRSKRSAGASNGKSASSGFVSHEKARSLPAVTSAVGASAGAGATSAATASAAAASAGAGAGGSGSLLSVSAGASTILANSSTSLDLPPDTLAGPRSIASIGVLGRQSQRFPRSKVAPLPPGGGVGSTAGSLALMSDHVAGGGSGRSGVAWPSGTIPARVKKLSWDDAAHDPTHQHQQQQHQHQHKDSAENGAALHEATNHTLTDTEHMNLTVYF